MSQLQEPQSTLASTRHRTSPWHWCYYAGQYRPFGLWIKALHTLWIITLWRNSFFLQLGLNRNWMLDQRSPCFHVTWRVSMCSWQHNTLAIVWSAQAKMDVYSGIPFSREVVYTKIRPWSFNNLHEEVTKCPWFLFLLYYCLSPNVYLWPHGEFPMSSWWKKRNNFDVQVVLMCMLFRHRLKVDSCSTTVLF